MIHSLLLNIEAGFMDEPHSLCTEPHTMHAYKLGSMDHMFDLSIFGHFIFQKNTHSNSFVMARQFKVHYKPSAEHSISTCMYM